MRLLLAAQPMGGLIVLLAVLALAVYKPRGMTPFGMGKLREAGAEQEPGKATSTPRWVTVFGVLVVPLVLMLGVMVWRGGHGPAVHS